jgi:hypothetical protein
VALVFQDAKIPGVSNPRDYPQIFTVLPFNGSYRGKSVGGIEVGLEPLNNTYDVIRNFDQRSEKEVICALVRMAVSTSEPMRSPKWMTTLIKVYRSGNSRTVDWKTCRMTFMSGAPAAMYG